MKKTLFLMGLLLSVAFLHAQKFDQKTAVSVLANQEIEAFASPAADCLAPQTLAVEYSEDCSEAVITWYAPSEMLWNNVVTSNTGYLSVRFMMEEFSRIILADDFVVPEGDSWIITAIDVYGFYKSGSGEEFIGPNYVGIEIYEDDGNDLPGNKIFEDPYLAPGNSSGIVPSGGTSLRLPAPIVIDNPGRYWISVYGTYETDYTDDSRYYLLAHEELIEKQFARYDEESGFWETFMTDQNHTSMYFRLKGATSTDPITYNLYRNDVLITTLNDELTYTDSGFDHTIKNTWKVSAVCPTGGESNRTSATKLPCGGIDENALNAFTISPNPANDVIIITAENVMNRIDVINFLGQTVLTQNNNTKTATLDISNLNNGVYFVRIISDNGTSVQKFVKQ